MHTSYWQVGLSLCAAVVYVIAMQQDLTRRKIPNALPLAIIVIAALKWIGVGQVSTALWALLAAVVVFVVTLLVFWRGWMGGGDVKLLTATSLLMGADDTYPFLLYTALMGGVVAVVIFIRTRLARRAVVETASVPPDSPASAATMAGVPYGVAIAVGALLVLFQQSTLR